jgi:hypothetical protein
MDIISPSVSPKIINNSAIMASPAGASTFVNGTGTATGSPITLATGSTVVVITGAGNFTVTLAANCVGIVLSGTAAVTGSPLFLEPGANTVVVVGTGNIVVELFVVNPLVSIPGIQTGYVKRLAVNNPTGGAANLYTADIYTPNSSQNNPTPIQTIKLRYPIYITAADWIDVNGHTISKHMGMLAILCDTPGVIVGYDLELQ